MVVFPSKTVLIERAVEVDDLFDRYAKDIILVIVLAQTASLIHRYLWFTLLIVRMLVYFSAEVQRCARLLDSDLCDLQGDHVVLLLALRSDAWWSGQSGSQ